MCLYSSVRRSTAADWIVEKSISVWDGLSIGRAREAKLLTCNPRLLDVYEMWLEHALWCLEPLLANLDDATIRELHGRLSEFATRGIDSENDTV